MAVEWSQWPRRHSRVIDIVVAVMLCALATYASKLSDETREQAAMVVRPASLAVFWLSATASVALLFRRRFPWPVLVITTGCALTIGALGFEVSVFSAGAAFVAMYSLGLWSSNLCIAKVAPLVAGGALLVMSFVHHLYPLLTGGRITLIAGIMVAGAFAEAGRSRRNYLAALHARAELAERTREEEARQRVGEERLRIARELHDIVAHHMALAHAQASTAAYLLRSQPDQAQEMLDQLAGTTSAALRELKSTVGLLREDDSDAPLEPTPGLGQLSELLTSFERTGLTVSVSITGVPRPLSPGADLTAYRIIQEALTNVTKHASTATATVRLVYSRLLLTISVIDDGVLDGPDRAASAEGPRGEQHSDGRDADGEDPGVNGYGLIGMNERANSVGGHLRAGRRPGGGFEVTTELPLEPATTPDHEDITP
ncbi:sensor histidine kinase [Nocardia jejuensis]|uniref:sensor histidine kinase n=1 Tax=Nocardia jejuensis TaxID=328049 RepID=UPI00082B03D7|nr:sensor histidine kinase [Nocardia jejuensis]